MEIILVLDEALVALFLTMLFGALKSTPLLDTPDKRAWIPLAAEVAGVLLYVLWYTWSTPDLSPLGYLAAVLNGAVVGAGAVGLHELRAAPTRIANS